MLHIDRHNNILHNKVLLTTGQEFPENCNMRDDFPHKTDNTLPFPREKAGDLKLDQLLDLI